MNPYYFGDSERPLFGIHHVPRSQRVRDTSVLLCYPVVQEYIRSHRALQQLSTALCKAGFHVFRFDYYGTGDSGGESSEGSVHHWKSDIVAARTELRDASGIDKISVVGLRFGATLAALTSQDGVEFEDLVLWDPVVCGKSYLRELRLMHQRKISQPRVSESTHAVRRETQLGDELLGFPLPFELQNAIEQADLLTSPGGSAKRTFLLVSEERNDFLLLRELYARHGQQIDYHLIPDAGDWDKLEKFDQALVAHHITRTIKAVLAPDLA